MAAQSANNLYETALQPDTGGHAYTFLEFNTQDDFVDYMDFQDLSQPSRSPAGPHPQPPPEPAPDSSASDHLSPEPTSSPSSSTPLGGPSSSSMAMGAAGGQAAAAAVDTLTAGMNELNFEESGDESYESGESDFTEHACEYCGVEDPECVVRCNISTCWKWFCRLQGNTGGSHIVNHLVQANHTEVWLPDDSPRGETIECFNCGCQNVFLLGFISSATGSVIVLCKIPCLNVYVLRGMNCDLS
ncbi:regulator of nonsense transcripts 1 homolog isoform X1 [Zingiber officinale]|uniref:regulator of nonsense transcripts 1 homolog isoform X1 n=1 Tax=Zingiber officinale TaxID=94328 RepID=UPI001C4B24C3|nr:regulator of nonsense transcripts 1 homolog isoform X1 [Zingiber officinale]